MTNDFQIAQILSPYKQFCDGFGTNHNPSYLLGCVLGIGKTKIKHSHTGSSSLDEIIAYDRAEIEDTYLGQINMSIVSSFSGPQGLIWGYDLVRPDRLKIHHPLAPHSIKSKYGSTKIYSLSPLLEATQALFGTLKQKHFPLHPGAHVPCAGKYINEKGPKRIYAALGLGIPENRIDNAALLMEDTGTVTTDYGHISPDDKRKIILANIVQSITTIGNNQNIFYREILVELKDVYIQDNEIGCALVAAPYFLLAQNAIPKHDPQALFTTRLDNWQKATRKYNLNSR